MLTRPPVSEVEERRCAIYTRRSLGVRVDEEFNSLQAQRAICSSYIASQRPNGWVEIPKHYDDAGRTGANLHRPALQDMLIDLEAGLWVLAFPGRSLSSSTGKFTTSSFRLCMSASQRSVLRKVVRAARIARCLEAIGRNRHCRRAADTLCRWAKNQRGALVVRI